ncbi:MAG: DUF420 domain-containing protein [Planctomycetota bacterium]
MHRALIVLLALLLAPAAAFAALSSAGSPAGPSARPAQGEASRPFPTSSGAPAPSSDARFERVPDFAFARAGGGELTRADLEGTTWIAVPFFLRCAGPCPSITRDVAERIYPALEGTGVRIVSFSIDPAFDTPEKLAAYAEGLDVSLDRWSFVSAPDEETMHTFLGEGLKFAVDRDPDADDPGLAITHSTRMPVVDAEGKIAGWYEIADPGRDNPKGAPALPAEEAGPILDARIGLLVNRALAVAGLDASDGPAAPSAARSRIPLLNASLNGLSFLMLLCGIVAIKKGQKELHRMFMRAAFVASALFLGFYLYYHFAVLPISGGPTKYNGTGTAKTLYLVMLASHVLLAIVNLPMVLRTFWLAHKEDWDRHKRLARWTFPIWLYVSVTGVAVYLVLYPFNPPPV